MKPEKETEENMRTKEEIELKAESFRSVLEESDFSEINPRLKRILAIKLDALDWVLNKKSKEEKI